MNKIMNNISDARKIFAGLLVGVLSLAGCTGKLDEPVNPTDDPLQFPDETQVTFKADITKASGEDTPHYVFTQCLKTIEPYILSSFTEVKGSRVS